MSVQKNSIVTSEWDATYKKLSHDEVLWSETPEIEDFIPIARQEDVIRILDAGCGDGKNLSALVRVPEFYCIGCDSSPTALQVCQREVVNRNQKYIEYGLIEDKRLHDFCLVESSVEKMPFPDNHFDALVCIDVINHNRNPYQIFDEIKRVVTNNGLIYFSLFNIKDDIINSDKHKHEMKPLDGGIKDREFIYSFTNTDNKNIDYYFRFLHEDEIDEFLKPTKFKILDKKVKYWKNQPHPHFRDYEHTHCNHMITVRNVKQ